MATTALGPGQGGPSHHLGDIQHIAQLDGSGQIGGMLTRALLQQVIPQPFYLRQTQVSRLALRAINALSAITCCSRRRNTATLCSPPGPPSR